MKYPILQGEMLTSPLKGIYTVTTWYSDGSVETIEISKGPFILIEDIFV